MINLAKPVIHCSFSEWGCALVYNSWHKARGWQSRHDKNIHIGYEAVILNGYPYKDLWMPQLNGSIEAGRPINETGAHTRGYNTRFGICLTGVDKFTKEQFISLRRLLQTQVTKPEDIMGHYQFNTYKTCPNFSIEAFQKYYVTGKMSIMKRWIKN
jgi:hypothetical protein